MKGRLAAALAFPCSALDTPAVVLFADTTNLYVTLEARTDPTSLGAFSVSTIPEPSTLAGLGLGLAGFTRRR